MLSKGGHAERYMRGEHAERYMRGSLKERMQRGTFEACSLKALEKGTVPVP
jgi:hypothetical protein